MSHIKGMSDRDLHCDDGTHRLIAPVAIAHRREVHEKRMRLHLELHKHEDHITQALDVANGASVITKRRRFRRKLLAASPTWQYDLTATFEEMDRGLFTQPQDRARHGAGRRQVDVEQGHRG